MQGVSGRGVAAGESEAATKPPNASPASGDQSMGQHRQMREPADGETAGRYLSHDARFSGLWGLEEIRCCTPLRMVRMHRARPSLTVAEGVIGLWPEVATPPLLVQVDVPRKSSWRGPH